MESKAIYVCRICDDEHDYWEAAADCCEKVTVLYECAICASTYYVEDDADDCCAEQKECYELDPLSAPATAEERAATGSLF